MHADRASRFDAPPQPSALLRQAMKQGLVPLTADAQTKARRELFVGNTPAGATERALADHLNSAMRAAGFCSAPGAPVISCRVSAAYAFIELRSVPETDHCLSLTGLPFLGGALKIGRPTKYDGPRTTAGSWARVAATIDAAALDAATRSQLQVGGADLGAAAAQASREVLINNVPGGTTEESLRAFLGLALLQAGGAAAAGDPLASVHLSGRHAFVGARSDQEALALLAIAGLCFRGTRLRIKRPSKYAGTDLPPGRSWTDVVADFGRGVAGDAAHDAALGDAPPPAPVAPDVARRLATLASAPATSVVVRGALAAARTLDAACADPALLADVHAECARYGAVERVALDGNDVVVDFALVDDAAACLAALKFKRFCGAQLGVEFRETKE